MSDRPFWFSEEDHKRTDKNEAQLAKRVNRPSWFTENDHQRADEQAEGRGKSVQQTRAKADLLFAKESMDIKGRRFTFGTSGFRVTDLEADNNFHEKGGWKLHITVQPKNYSDVDHWLFENHRGQYKLLSGGEDGKTFTIYVGSRTDAEALTRRITKEIGHLLEENTSGISDTIISGKVAGRFDVYKSKRGTALGFGLYSIDGIPFDQDAIEAVDQVDLNFVGKKDDPQRISELKKVWDHEMKRIRPILESEYGIYFTGEEAP